MMVQLVVLILCASGLSEGDEVPEVLARSISRRMAFDTAFFRYERNKRAPDTGAMMLSRFETRMSNEGTYWYDMGDAEGVLHRDYNTGQPIFNVMFACSPKHTVRCRKTGDEWFRHDGEQMLRLCTIERTPNPFNLADPRSIGLSVQDLRDKSPSQWLEELQAATGRWSQREDNGLVEVTMATGSRSDEHSELVWIIDPKKDGAIVEVRGYYVRADGTRKLLDTTRNDYQRYNDRWWLSRSDYQSSALGTVETVTFHHAEFDRPDHPKIENADVLNLPSGFKVADLRTPWGGKSRKLDRYIGNGEIVSDEQWNEIKGTFDLEPLKKFEKEQFAFGAGTHPRWWNADETTLGLENVAHTPDMWEAYVRRWILRFNHDTVSKASLSRQAPKAALSAAQIESAWGIYRDCRKQAEPIVRRMNEEAEEARAAQAKRAEEAGQLKPGEAAESKTNPHERKLAEIFDTLKKRLSKLLMTKQESEVKAKE